MSGSVDGSVIVWDVKNRSTMKLVSAGGDAYGAFKSIEAEECNGCVVSNDKQQFYSDGQIIRIHRPGGTSEVLASFESKIMDIAVRSNEECLAVI